MNALAEKMEDAGIDTLGAKLTTLCIDGIRANPSNVEWAWHYVGLKLGHGLIRSLMSEMEAPPQRGLQEIPVATYKPRVIPPERIERQHRFQQTARSKFKNSDGVSWSDVGWHELPALARDGKEAAALLAAGPANVPNDGRSVEVVLGIQKTNAIIEAAREA